jgi:hypothetical protein
MVMVMVMVIVIVMVTVMAMVIMGWTKSAGHSGRHIADIRQ